jgi:formamidopyrimidine-DNA glycosylase
MPELPEVETVCRGLEKSILGKRIAHAETMRADLRFPFPDDMCERLEGASVRGIRRRSKYILIEMDSDDIWIIHLGMSGRVLVLDEEPETLQKHDHVLVRFEGGTTLVYNDARRFGIMDICTADDFDTHALIKDLGPEPLTDVFDEKYMRERIAKKHSPIKHVIMDAHVVVGVGNIYACESLFRSSIDPTRKASSLSKKEVAVLVVNIKKILKSAIASGGSSLRDYVQATGEMGYFQHKFAVYGREGEPCEVCERPIERIKQQNRSTFYCVKCQG